MFKTCKSCEYYQASPPEAKAPAMGICFQAPPSVMWMPVAGNALVNGADRYAPVSVRPTVRESEGCSFWRGGEKRAFYGGGELRQPDPQTLP